MKNKLLVVLVIAILLIVTLSFMLTKKKINNDKFDELKNESTQTTTPKIYSSSELKEFEVMLTEEDLETTKLPKDLPCELFPENIREKSDDVIAPNFRVLCNLRKPKDYKDLLIENKNLKQELELNKENKAKTIKVNPFSPNINCSSFPSEYNEICKYKKLLYSCDSLRNREVEKKLCEIERNK